MVGTTIVGDSKLYAVPTYERQVKHIFSRYEGQHIVDSIAAVDKIGRWTTEINSFQFSPTGDFYATEIIYYGKEALKKYALENNYDYLVWQGIDCYYDSVEDFIKLINNAPFYHVFGALVAGRNRENYPVCRQYIPRNGTISTAQYEFDPGYLLDDSIIPVRGYPGSDATCISRWALENVSMEKYKHWHEIKDEIEDALGPEEWFMYSAIKNKNVTPYVDTSIRCWHAHETGKTVRYPGEVIDLSELDWEEGKRKLLN